eukprot:m.87178 g.87178  ORF g.87178 m.87178 type:complete len:189 (-) comp13094_c0_seq1:1147-1713(-)
MATLLSLNRTATRLLRQATGKKFSIHTQAFLRHDHSKNIIGRDDGSSPNERPKDWWEVREEIPDDAPEVNFIIRTAAGRSDIAITGKVGESIEDVAKRGGYVEGACDGNCQCSTCHVFIPEESDRVRLKMPDSIEEFELDMLELAPDYEKDPDGSRLSCQIVLSEELEGVIVQLPSRTTNYMDHIPFE